MQLPIFARQLFDLFYLPEQLLYTAGLPRKKVKDQTPFGIAQVFLLITYYHPLLLHSYAHALHKYSG